MTEDEKRRFDAWESLRDHAWREFEEKSKAKWQLSFGIWAALLASAGALIASGTATIKEFRQQEYSYLIVLVMLALVVIADVAFLYWIQRRLQKARDYLSDADIEMRKLLGEPSERHDRSILKQIPLYVEAFITLLLAGVFFVVFRYAG